MNTTTTTTSPELAALRLVEAYLVTQSSYPTPAFTRWRLPIEKAIDNAIEDISGDEVQLGELLEEFSRQAAGWLADLAHAQAVIEQHRAAIDSSIRDWETRSGIPHIDADEYIKRDCVCSGLDMIADLLEAAATCEAGA
jgi:hypothetical protein